MRHGSRYSGAIDPLSVVATIEANVADWLSTLATFVPGARVERHADLTVSRFPLRHPFTNAVIAARIAERGCLGRVSEVTGEYTALGLPVVWWLGPSTRPLDLSQRLRRQGYLQIETLVGMAADLHRDGTDLTRDDLTEWREVETPQHVSDWASPFQDGFGKAPDLIEHLASAYRSRTSLKHGALRLFVAYDKGEPVSCMMLHVGGGVAGVYGVATTAHARGRGLAPRLARHALRAARDSGCRTAVLHATSMAVSMYASLGFVEYCRLRTFTPHSVQPS